MFSVLQLWSWNNKTVNACHLNNSLMNLPLLCLTSTFSCLGKLVAWFKHVPTNCSSSIWDVIIQRGWNKHKTETVKADNFIQWWIYCSGWLVKIFYNSTVIKSKYKHFIGMSRSIWIKVKAAKCYILVIFDETSKDGFYFTFVDCALTFF